MELVVIAKQTISRFLINPNAKVNRYSSILFYRLS